MINIITGEINSGKTTVLQSIYRHLNKGDGIALPKYFIDGRCSGQRIVQLSTGKTELFSHKSSAVPDGWVEKIRYDSYSFSNKGMSFAEKVFERIIKEQISPAFVDEIGPLELRKDGFYRDLTKIISLQNELFIAVRSSCLSDVLQLFDIHTFCLLNVCSRLVENRVLFSR
ncbi:MAG: hypothetical protein N2Z65_07935 [Clostridiales bacterium]|nr:hypothetical protein [Clostridiales bacterium]